MATLTLAQKLVQAEDAYHRLMIGGQPLRGRRPERRARVRYTGHSAQLRAYILELQRAIASNGSTPTTGPMGVIF